MVEGGFLISRYLDEKYGTDKPQTEEQKTHEAYALRLQELGYQETGPLEKLLVNALETGLYGSNELDVILVKLSRQVELSEAQRFLTNEVWNLYHSSFEDNEQQFVDAMLACFTDKSADLSINNLNEAVLIMEKLGREDVAETLCCIYFEAHPKLDSEHEWHQLYRHENSPRIENRLKTLSSQNQTDTSSANVKHIIHGMIVNNGWNPRDIDILNMYDEDDCINFSKRI